jgi:uncharacterized protein YkwD
MAIDDILHKARRRMRPASRCAAAVAIGAAALTGVANAETREETCPGAAEEPAAETQVRAVSATICLINEERERHHVPQLREQEQLTAAAEGHARDMVRRHYFGHVSPGGTTMTERLREAGFIRSGDAWAVGETLAWGRGRPARPSWVVAAWFDSAAHRRVLLDRRYRRLGVGLAPGIPRPGAGGLGGATYAAELGVRW